MRENLDSGSFRRRAAELLVKAEDVRSRLSRRVRGGPLGLGREPFSDPAAWQRRAARSPARVYGGQHVSWAHDGTTLEVTLQREPCNEIGSETLAELERLAEYLVDGAGGARAVLFHSAVPTGFSAGADLRELYREMVARKAAGVRLSVQLHELRDFIDRIHAVYDVFDTVPMTTIGAVHGVVFGGGFELALTCDVLVADKSARFCFPELRLGLVPGWGGVPRLNRDVGNAVVRDLLLSGRSLRATRAQEVGLVSQVVARGQALDVARKVAEQSARFDARTTALAKPFLKPVPRAELDREKELFTRLFTSPVVEASLRRFVESDDKLPYLP